MLRCGGDPGGSRRPPSWHLLSLLRVTDSESEESHGLHPHATQQGPGLEGAAVQGPQWGARSRPQVPGVSPGNHAGGTFETAQAALPLGAPINTSGRQQVTEPRCSGRGGALLRLGGDRARGTEEVTAIPRKYMAFVKIAEENEALVVNYIEKHNSNQVERKTLNHTV